MSRLCNANKGVTCILCGRDGEVFWDILQQSSILSPFFWELQFMQNLIRDSRSKSTELCFHHTPPSIQIDKRSLQGEGLCSVRDYINKIMNDEEDQFFVEPQIQEVHHIQQIESPNNITDKPLDEPKHIPLKMIEIPKQEQNLIYRPFHFEHRQSSQEQEEDSPINQDFQSPFLDAYNRQQCVYQRLRNQQYNRMNGHSYFSGAFLHRNIFLQGNYSQTFDLSQATKLYYQSSTESLPQAGKEDLLFDSHFESGNLFAAFKTGEFQYDLVMSNDVNSIGNNQWFYFSVERMLPEKEYTFSVVNFTKSDSLFNYGMAPAVYSLAENKFAHGVEKGWKRQGKDVVYKKGVIPRENSRRMYYKLTFKLSTPYEKDKLFIAHSYPYTCEKLTKYLNDKISKNKELVTKFTAGKTLSKRIIQAISICQPLNKKRDSRKAIIVMARQHPGQTQGSFVCEGVIDRLLSKSKEADFLLKNFVIYVIPMVNPDGVAFGHYRTNLSGKDLNRKWNATEKDLNCPQVGTIKTFIQEISKEREIRFILDLHGHSKKLNSFFYGNPNPDNPDVVRVFPYVCSKLHAGVQYIDCTFSSEQSKRKAARVYLSYLYKQIHVYTFQSSFYAYFKEGRKIEFTPKEYEQLGATLVNALSMQLEHQVRFQQASEFNLKKINTKEYLNSPFVKLLTELKNNKELLEQGTKFQSGSQSKPEENQINNEEMEGLKPVRPSSTPSTQEINNSKTMKVSRKGNRDNKDYSFNKPIRNIKFLQISRVNSILPDKYQLGLQPIKKKETVSEISKQHRVATETQTQPKNQLKNVQFKIAQIQNCLLSCGIKSQSLQERKYSSVIRSTNRNIIFKFDMFGQTTSRQEESIVPKQPLIYKQAYSQTIITYSKEQGEKLKSSQILPIVQTPQRDEKRWGRNNSIRVEPTMRSGIRRQAQLFFNGVVKKLMSEKQSMRNEQMSNKFVLQKPLNIKRKQISKK